MMKIKINTKSDTSPSISIECCFLSIFWKFVKNRPSEIYQKSIFYFFSTIYIKLEKSPVFKALKLEIAPWRPPKNQKSGFFLYFSLSSEI